MYTITQDWIREYATASNAGWTRQQLRYVGVSWPPRKGWRSNLSGKQISDKARFAFEALGRMNQDKKRRAKKRHEIEIDRELDLAYLATLRT